MLFELPEHGFYAETITAEPDERRGMKIQICARENHAGAAAFDKGKAELLIKPLSPEQVSGVISNGLFLSAQVDFRNYSVGAGKRTP